YLASFPSRAAAERTARLVRGSVPDTRTMIVRRGSGEHAVARAIEAAAASVAARFALIAIGVVVAATLLLVASQTVDHGVSLALGGATAMTAAPFVGGLAGLVVGFRRWHEIPFDTLPGHSIDEGDTWLLVRTADAERLAMAVSQPERVTRPDPLPDPA